MNCLAVDTTDSRLTAVLIKDGDAFCREIEVGKSGHSRLLMPVVDELFKESGLNVGDLDAVAAVVGPGSFTGIRIGVSAMTALAFATDAKRISVTSFELIAYNRENATALVDAGHSNAYLAECRDGKVVSARFVEAEERLDLTGAVSEPACERCRALECVVRQKLAREEFCEVLAPYYMRKSQAEREKDEV